MARPTKYHKKYLKKIDEYLKCKQDEIDEFHKTRGDKSDSYEQVIKVNLPSKEDFAFYIGISRKTLYNWAKENEEFAYGLDRIHNEQYNRLLNGGLSGIYNPIISKLGLTSNHGMKDRVDETSGDEPISPFSDEQVDRIAERVFRRKRGAGDTSGKK